MVGIDSGMFLVSVCGVLVDVCCLFWVGWGQVGIGAVVVAGAIAATAAAVLREVKEFWVESWGKVFWAAALAEGIVSRHWCP